MERSAGETDASSRQPAGATVGTFGPANEATGKNVEAGIEKPRAAR